MPEYERSKTVEASPEETYAYVADVRNLTAYVATMVLAEPAPSRRLRVAAVVQGRHEEGEGRFSADPRARRLEWGGGGGSRYAGWLQVSEADGGRHSLVTLHISTQREEEGDIIDRALDETLANVRRLVTTG